MLREMTERFGDSYYLVDLGQFQQNYTEFLGAFRARYPNSRIAYSYKTNYTPRICRLVNQNGGYAEVVSMMEYDLAIQLGVHPQHIIFNGPFKREKELAKALVAGSIVNLDSYYEVELIEKISQRYPDHQLTIGLRCNFEVEPTNASRFGFDISRPEFKEMIRRLGEIPNCDIVGLHCHFLSLERSAAFYGKIASSMLEIKDAYLGDRDLRFIDLGGGFFSKMSESLRSQFQYPIPDFDEYAQAIAVPCGEIRCHCNGCQVHRSQEYRSSLRQHLRCKTNLEFQKPADHRFYR
jgi:diaminopimelate decarboxylase